MTLSLLPRLPADLALLSDEELEATYAASLAELGIEDEDQARQVLEVETAELLEQYARIEGEHPLAASVLWQRDDAAWDQRRLVATLTEPLELVLGGNRSGKTYAILQAALAFALGGDHPAVRAWLEDNDLPRDLVPDGPGDVFLVARTAESSVLYHRLTLDRLLPASGVTWRGKHANGPAELEIAVPGYDRPARIWFKSVDAGHGSFKGTEVRFVAISEEPEGEEGKRVVEECLRACSSVGGRVVLEMTPQLGFTWVYEDLYEAQQYGCKVVVLDSEHNVLVPDHKSLMRWIDSLPPEQRAMRKLGKFTNLEGLVYPGFTRGDGERWGLGNLCDPFPIPKDWPKFRGVDFGLTNPTAVVWGALGDDNTLYVYRLLHEPSPTFREHAEFIAELEQREGEVIEASWADPSNPKAIDIFCQAGVFMGPADNAVNAGISRVAERLRIRPDERPRLKVFTDCRVGLPGLAHRRKPGHPLVREIEGYRWNPKMKVPEPIKKNDHAMDGLRYLVVGIDSWLGL